VLWVNRIVGAAIIVAAFLLWELAAEFPADARQFPRVTLVAIALLSAIMIARSFISAVAPIGDGEGTRSLAAIIRPIAVFVLVVLAVIAMHFIGFFPAMAALALCLMPLLQVKYRISYGLACLSLFLFIYVLFVAFLNVPLTTSQLLSF